MFNYYNSMPTSTQPYGYPMPQQYQAPTTNTNKIFVGGIEDVKNRALMPNSDVIFLDNDKPLLYVKTVDSKGQYDIKTYKISEYKEPDNCSIKYASVDDVDSLRKEIKELKERLNGGANGISGTNQKIASGEFEIKTGN